MNKKSIISVLIAVVVSTILLSIPRLVFATSYCWDPVFIDSGCKAASNIGLRCVVVNNSFYTYEEEDPDFKSECTLENNINGVYGDCEVEKNVKIIHFQSIGETKIDEPITINLEGGETFIFSGNKVSWAKNENVFKKKDDDRICGTGATRATTPNATISDLVGDYKAKIKVKGLPEAAPLTFDGPGTVIFRDMLINAKCIVLEDDDPANDDISCGHVIRVRNGAKVIFENSHIIVGLGYRSFVDIKDGDKSLFSRVAFKESNVAHDYEPITKIYSKAVSVFSSDASRLIRPDVFNNVKFEHIGVRLMVPTSDGVVVPSPDNFFWNGYHSFMDAPMQPRIKCKMDTLHSCVIDFERDLVKYEDSIEGGYNEFLNIDIPAEDFDDVLYIEKDGDRINFSSIGVEFEEIGEDALRLKLPEGFDVNNFHLMTNFGQAIDVVLHKCPDGRPLVNDDGSYTCPAPEGAVFDGDTWIFMCLDPSATYDEYNNECVCEDGLQLIDGACKHKFESVIHNNITVDASSIFGPEIDDDTLIPGDDDLVEEDDITAGIDIVVDIAEQNCLASGGTWIDDGLMGSKCEYKDQEGDASTSKEDDNTGSYSGCSLTVSSKASSSNFWLVFLAAPILMLWVRRNKESQ